MTIHRLCILLIAAPLLVLTAKAVSISPGETKTNYIAFAGQQDTYTFSANAGDTVTILMGWGGGSLSPRVELYALAPSGSPIASDSGNYSATIATKKLTQAGTYYIVCRDQVGTFTGTYGMSLIKNPGPNVGDPEGGVIQPGETKTGSITLGDMDAYSFSANAGDTVTILMGWGLDGTGLCPQVDLHAPNGSLIASGSGNYSATIAAKKLAQTGTYLIVCRDRGAMATGTYGMSLIKNPGPNVGDPEGGVIQPGVTKTGSITLGDMDAYSFSANAGDTVSILMTWSGGGLSPQVELHAPDGTVVKSDSGSYSATIAAQKLAQAGIYLVVCRDGFGIGKGTYGVSLTRIGGSTQPVLLLRVQGGSVQLSLQGESGRSYLIQSSLNLTSWSDVGTVVAASGVAQTNQPVSGGKKFFRAILKP